MDDIIIGNSGVKNKPYIVLKGGWVDLPNGDRMYIYTGYTFDNGSIPKVLKWLYDTFKWEFLNYLQKAFLVHDYLYNYRGYHTGPHLELRPITRALADDFMAYFMKKNGNSDTKIKVFYMAVRICGWPHFGKM